MKSCILAILCVLLLTPGTFAQQPPNIVFIMSDELAYYELGHMGNSKFHTPNIDRMARQGIRFTQALAAAPVCAPLRCALMTGKHMGHASVRANDGGTPLRSDEPTIASALKKRGYTTGGFGKWGAGGRGSTGVPEKHGFDIFFGYYDQVHAHSFYPPYLIKNSQEVPLEGNVGGRDGKSYSHYAIMDQALSFIRSNKDRPFFCYLPITPPHGMYDIPSDDPAWEQYRDDAWVQDPSIGQDVKNYAAMVTMVDNNLGQVLTLLQELRLEENTIVFFTGDNGGQDRFKDQQYPRGFFGPNVDPRTGVDLRGQKGSLYEGGLRIPFLVSWPGKIEAGQVSNLLFSQVDMFPTLAELAQAESPDDLDGLSILPTLLGAESVGHEQAEHEFLYWEFGNQVAVRIGDWKGVKPNPRAEWALYDLNKDASERNDVATQHPEIVASMESYAEQSHEPVRAGSYFDRQLHEKDRQAKWGTSQAAVVPTHGKVNELQHPQLIPASKMKLVRVSSENAGNRKLARFAIDGNPKTIWHTQFSPELAEGPHELVIDLGATYQISGVQYLTRQDNGWNGSFGKTVISVSDSTEFTAPEIEHSFRKQKSAQTVSFPKVVEGRYVRIQILSEVNGGPWASAAEMGILGSKR